MIYSGMCQDISGNECWAATTWEGEPLNLAPPGPRGSNKPERAGSLGDTEHKKRQPLWQGECLWFGDSPLIGLVLSFSSS